MTVDNIWVAILDQELIKFGLDELLTYVTACCVRIYMTVLLEYSDLEKHYETKEELP